MKGLIFYFKNSKFYIYFFLIIAERIKNFIKKKFIQIFGKIIFFNYKNIF